MQNRVPSRRALSWVARGVRVTVVGALVVGAFALVGLRMGEARAAELGMNFGEELLAINESHASGDIAGDVYDVDINGQHVESSNASTARSMHEVLSYFASECKEHADGLRDKFADMKGTVATLTPGHGSPGSLAIQEEYVGHGFVFCIATKTPLSNADVVAQLGEFNRTGDLGAIGELRYVTYRESPSGNLVAAAWTSQSFNLHTMFPKEGDAPGQDFGSVPRPDGARRTVSATIAGSPGGINSYLVKGDPDEVRDALTTKLTQAGWSRVQMSPKISLDGLGFTLGSKLDLIVTANASTKGMTSVSYVVSRTIGTASR
jgi:hypothetical protein